MGLTSSHDAGQDEPERFYPSGKRTFVRLPAGRPGAGRRAGPADALAGCAQRLRARRPGPVPAAARGDRRRAGDRGRGRGRRPRQHRRLPPEPTTPARSKRSSRATPRPCSSPAAPGPGTVALWKRLHGADPQLLLLGSSSLATPEFTSAIGAAGERHLPHHAAARAERLPARRAARAGRPTARRSTAKPGRAVLYGYEAMSGVLAAIRRAGAHGNDRPDVIRRLLATHDRDSVLGRYSVPAQRRNDALDLRRRPRRRRQPRVLARDRHRGPARGGQAAASAAQLRGLSVSRRRRSRSTRLKRSTPPSSWRPPPASVPLARR